MLTEERIAGRKQKDECGRVEQSLLALGLPKPTDCATHHLQDLEWPLWGQGAKLAAIE